MYIEHPFEGLSHSLVQPSGPSPCNLLFIGESPGKEEDAEGFPFVGKTGRELDKFYLPLAWLQRREIRVTNLIPCHPWVNRNPTKDEIAFFEHILLAEIEKTKPKIICTLGAYAAKYFLGPHRDLHQIHGLLFESKKFGCSILPCYHPAAGLYSNDTQPLIVDDFQQIRHAIDGTLPPRAVDQFKDPIYIELTTRAEVFQSLDGAGAVLMGGDTEGYKGSSWGLSYSIAEGVGYIIRAASKEAISAFAEWVRLHPECKIILHNALHDLPIYREMGIYITNFEDTMVYAYCLCTEPQGLKDLAYRLVGMKMKSYSDVVEPAVRKLTTDYLIKVASGDWGLDPEVPEMESAQEVVYRQPQALHKRALRAVNDILGFYTGTIIGSRKGGSAKLDEFGVRVGKVDHETVASLGLRKEIVTVGKKNGKAKITHEQEFNAWLCEVPIPVKPILDEHYGEFIFDLKEPVPPEDPPDSIKRWTAMSEDLEESVQRCSDAIGRLPVVGLDALEDQEVAVKYSGRDAHATIAIRPHLVRKIENAGLMKLAQLDMAVLPYLDRMASTGIKVNRKHMLEYGDVLKTDMRQLQDKLNKDLGIWINPSSSKQVAMLIYDILGFPVEFRTKGGDPSTNDKVLEALAPQHPNINDITDFRELHKLRSTYALSLPLWMDEMERLHATWKYTRVASGRLSTADPNLLGIPTRSNRGKMIRAGFIPGYGRVFISCDLSQIEVRVAAHYSQDPNLIKIFMSKGADFHTLTTSYMWKITPEAVKADDELNGGSSMRSSAKNVSFGVLYGISAKGLQAQLKSKCHTDWSEEQCQDMIDKWLEEAYPQVKWYMERQKAICRQKGYVESLFGRRRYLPGMNSTIPRIRAEAERSAINHPIQGCLPADTRVLTPEGWLRVDEWNGQQLWTGEKWATAIKLDRGKAKRIRLHLSDGRTFDCDDRHKLLVRGSTWHEWCDVKEIVGRELVRDGAANEWGLPDAHSIEDWYWAGRFQGDGSINCIKNKRWSLSFASYEQSDLDRMLKWLAGKDFKGKTNSKCGYGVCYDINKNPTVYGFSEKGLNFWRSFDLDKQNIRPHVFKLDKSRRRAFLDGYYDADGLHHGKALETRRSGALVGGKQYLKLTCKYRSTLADVLRLSETLGITGSIGKEQSNAVASWSDLGFHRIPAPLSVERIEEFSEEQMYTFSVDDPKHAFSSEGLISKNTAAEILKLAQVAVYNKVLPKYWDAGIFVEPVLSIHDEIVIEADITVAEEVRNEVIYEMEHAMELIVPVVSEGKISRDGAEGGNWADLKQKKPFICTCKGCQPC